jgi:hypothetical protein
MVTQCKRTEGSETRPASTQGPLLWGPRCAGSCGPEPVPAAPPLWAAWPPGPACGSGCGSARHSGARKQTERKK